MEALDVLSWTLLVSGGLVSIVSTFGALRLRGLFQRMHGAAMMDTLGAALVLGGLALQAGTVMVAFKLLFVFGLLALTTSTAAHALAKAALADGVRPIGVDPVDLERKLERVAPRMAPDREPHEEESASLS